MRSSAFFRSDATHDFSSVVQRSLPGRLLHSKFRRKYSRVEGSLLAGKSLAYHLSTPNYRALYSEGLTFVSLLTQTAADADNRRIPPRPRSICFFSHT